MAKKKSEHYVNNKQLLEALIVYRGKVAAAAEEGKPNLELQIILENAFLR